MGSLKKTAEEFCRVCTTASKDDTPYFDYNDLNEVMLLVDRFCESSHPICSKCGAPDHYTADKRFRVFPGFGNKTIYGGPQLKYYADIVQMYESGHQETVGSARSDSLCQALLAACVDAAKKLRP